MWKRVVGVGVTAIALAGCGHGITGPASSVTDISATLSGDADRTEPGAIDWWFEYGPTTDYGSSTTEAQNVFVTEPIPVTARLDDLEPETIYHYRLCAHDAEEGGRGACGSDRTFTTRALGDHVRGHIEVSSLFEPPLHVGIQLNAFSDADGANPSGGVVGYSDDFTVSGTVTCLRIVNNRAAIGFLTNNGGPWVAYIFDNGGSGDSFDASGVSAPLTVCPVPPAGPYSTVSNFGDVQFIDTP